MNRYKLKKREPLDWPEAGQIWVHKNSGTEIKLDRSFKYEVSGIIGWHTRLIIKDQQKNMMTLRDILQSGLMRDYIRKHDEQI